MNAEHMKRENMFKRTAQVFSKSNVKQEKSKDKISVDNESQQRETTPDVDGKGGAGDVIDDTLSLNLDEVVKTSDDSGSECQNSRSGARMSPSKMEPFLTRRGTYVLTNGTLRDRRPLVKDRYSILKKYHELSSPM